MSGNDNKVRIVLDVAYQPQVRTETDTRRIMMDVIIALMPAQIVAIFQFGWRPLGVAITPSKSLTAKMNVMKSRRMFTMLRRGYSSMGSTS